MSANERIVLSNPHGLEYNLDPRILWQKHEVDELDDVFDRPDDTYMCFGIFYLDIFSTSVETELNNVLEVVQAELKDWTNQYPWSSFTDFSLSIEKLDSKTPYIFGYLNVHSNRYRESSLIVGILHELSQRLGPHTFIKLCDSDGDVLLSDAHEVVPSELEYPVGSNRLWLTEGNFKIIPTSFYPTRGLTSSEVMEFLAKASYKLITIEALKEKLESLHVKAFSKRQFSDMKKISISVEDHRDYKILEDNPTAINFIISRLHQKTIQIDTDSPMKNDARRLDCLSNITSRSILSTTLDMHDLTDNTEMIPVYAGRLISGALHDMLKENILTMSSETKTQTLFDLPKTANVFKDYTFETASLTEVPEVPEIFTKTPGVKEFMDSYDEFRTKKHQNSPPGKTKPRFDHPLFPDDIEEMEDFTEFMLKETMGLSDDKVEEMTPTDEMPISELLEVMSEFNEKFDPKVHKGEELTKLFKSLNMNEKDTRAFESTFRLFSGHE